MDKAAPLTDTEINQIKMALEKEAGFHFTDKTDLIGVETRKLLDAQIQKLHNLGYRKLPKDKPPVISTYGVIAENSSHRWAKEIWAHYEQEFNWIAQAQLDVCVKHYEGQ